MKRPLWILSFFLVILIMYIRFQVLILSNGDLALIQTWYNFLKQNGVMGLANGEFSNYPPAYLYLLWLSTLFLDSVPAIKLIPTLFDVVSAIAIYKIARIKFNNDKSFLFAIIFLLLPTVTLNSTGWGQIDSAYTSFLLVCFYFLLKEKPLNAMLAFGVAFSFKAQSIFLLPFLGIMFLRKQISWYYFFIIPVVYIVLALPTLFLGRSLESILFLYAGQVDQFENLSRYAPNLYFVIPNEFYHPIFEIGLGIFFISMLIWAWINWKAGDKVTQKQIAFTALASASLIPFLLPKMHDRYFYPADVFSYAIAVLFPEIWFVPIMFQVSSTIAYSVFLFGAQPIVVLIGSLINTALVIVIIRKQLQSLKEKG
ncbi:MAG: glycosyltransferase family 39 protein [Anaerolineales bacterium]|nr:glycosyltransferase family 39 protein [Anaerolineales bacterium]